MGGSPNSPGPRSTLDFSKITKEKVSLPVAMVNG